MQRGFLSALKKILADRHRRKVWQRLVSSMMAVVVFCTTYALILPGITLERQAYCGLEEHTHSDECYTSDTGQIEKMICSPESDAEFVIHTHDDKCYVNGNFVCQLDELEEHEHSDDCYTETTELVCELEESEGHTHTDECYELTLGDLTCDDTSETHEHDDSCYEQVEELVCGQEETEGHTHDENCYNKVQEVVCDLPKVVEHKHSESCYKNGVLSCGLPEIIKHQHTDECFEKVTLVGSEVTETVCGKQEHKHTEDCYKTSEETNGNSGGGGATVNGETTTATEGATESTTSGALTEAATETTTTAHEDLVFPYSDEKVSGIITLPWSDELPEDLKCTAVMITDEDENYNSMLSSVGDEIAQDGREVDKVFLYRLEWSVGDDTYVLPEGLIPTVQLTLIDTENEGTYVEGLVISEKEDADEDTSDKATAVNIDKFAINTIGDVMDINDWVSDTSEVQITAFDVDDENEDLVPPEIDADAVDELLQEDTISYSAQLVTSGDDETGISAELTETGIFAFALTSEPNYGTGGFYKRVTDISEFDTISNRYLIVAQNGLLALRPASGTAEEKTMYTGYKYDSSSGKYVATTKNSESYSYTATVMNYDSRPVEIQRIPTSLDYETNNNPEYYRIVDPNDNDNPVVPSSSNYEDCFTYIWDWDGNGNFYYTQLSYNYAGYSKANAMTFYSTENSTSYPWMNFSKTSGVMDTWHIRGLIYDYGRDVYTGEVNAENKWLYSYLYCDGSSISQKHYLYGSLCETQFQLYKYVGDSLDIQSDITAASSAEDSSAVESTPKEKPDCDDFIDVSGAQTIDATFGENHIFSGANISAKSDPASSLIEDELCLDNDKSDLTTLYSNQQKNDGRLLTDKSVIYGADDYDAIGSEDYQDGDFSIALSALGQEWSVIEDSEETNPMDVVLILDLSNSMKESVTYMTGDVAKWQATADAINYGIKAIMESNDKNRVGLVAYSDSGKDILPIGRYSCDDGNIITYTSGDVTTLRISDTLYDGYTTDDSRTESTYRSESLYKDESDPLGYVRGLWGATYTQWGFQQAYEMFRQVDSTTVYLSSLHKNIIRQPVTILLTDGDPTFTTYNYMNPKIGPVYGSGCSNGVEGFYTILSANYFKNLTSIFYNKKSCTYTIGMGVKPSGYGTYYEDIGRSPIKYGGTRCPDSSYTRTILNPTKENIDALDQYSQGWLEWYDLTSDKNFIREDGYAKNYWQTTGMLLRELLTGKTLDGDDIDPGSIMAHTMYWYSGEDLHDIVNNYGIGGANDENVLSGIDNPYKDDYNYADGAFFGQFDTEKLDSVFDRIIGRVQLNSRYDYLLEKGTNVVMTDPLGTGMAVKGKPVLRYFDTNYTVTDEVNGEDDNSTYTDYYWKKTAERDSDVDSKFGEMTVDIGKIVARVSTDKTTGDQTVTLTIPEDVLPVFYPDSNRNFYYEELPVRLIYRVGLSESEEQKLKAEYNKNNYVDATYYTNKFNADGSAAGTVKFMLEDGNPYYTNLQSNVIYNKEENTSGTAAYNFSESYNKDTGEVTQLLGNNGVLQVEKDGTTDITVKKEWDTDDTTHPDKVNVALYVKGTQTDADGNETSFARICDLVELNDDNNWEYTWEKLKRTEVDDDGNTYNYDIYYVGELSIDGYTAVYRNADDTILDNSYKKFDFTSDMSKYVYDPDYGFRYTYLSWNSSLDDDYSDSAEDEEAEEEVPEEDMSAYSVAGNSDEDVNIEPMVAASFRVVLVSDVVDATSGEVIIRNTKTYNLPAAGGCGYVLEIAAIIMILCVLVMCILKKFGLNQNKD